MNEVRLKTDLPDVFLIAAVDRRFSDPVYYANIENIRTGTSTHMGGFRTLSELKTELWRRRTNKVIGGISDLYPKNQLPYDIVYQAHYELVTIIDDLDLLDALEED